MQLTLDAKRLLAVGKHDRLLIALATFVLAWSFYSGWRIDWSALHGRRFPLMK
jgi:hypothetical protein